MSYYINNQPAENYGVKNIAFVFRNQDVDEAVVTFAADVDVAFWPNGYALDIKSQLPGFSVFRGELRKRRREGVGSLEAIRLTFRGPWYHFDRTPYGRNNFYTNTAQYSTRFLLGGTVTAMVTSAVNIMIGLGHCQMGAIDLPNITMPSEEARDRTVGQVIRAALRWVPGAEVSFDYSTAPPSIYVLGPASTLLETYSKTVSVDPLARIAAGPLDERKVTNVILLFERLFNSRSTVYDPAKTYVPYDVVNKIFQAVGNGSVVDPDTQSENLYELIGLDQYPAGGVTSGSLMKSIVLNGQKRWRNTYYRQNNWTTGFNNLAWYRNHINNLRYLFSPWQIWMANIGQFTASDVAWSATPVSKVTGSEPDPSRFFAIFDKYQPPEELWRSDAFNDGYEVWEISHAAKWSQVGGSASVFMTQRQYWFNAYSFNGVLRDWLWVSRAIEESDPVLEAMPTGLARSMYDELARDVYEIETETVDTEAEFLSAKMRKVTLVGHGTGYVQEVAIDAFTGRTTVTVGVPQHLGVQDFIEQLRAKAVT